ncbi:hypothetical protein [Roseomonas xinghualingensis]|uniref:hypothetical protein n=1 Tax=Roseomonas xinghualingensis TaxID=2986475 RepID=UPI0021F18CDB|nr:hypothetical protein [Roseomonas sp. SXEYE001]MCV4206623.1 hypothetical protein [Roseomonas sp. SXEYE001]
MSGAISGANAAFYTNYPSGYAPAAPSSGAGGSTVTDIVDIRVPLPSGSFTARAGDSYSVRELFGSPDAAVMRIALRGEGGGRLMLRGEDVTDRVDFDPMDYNELQFIAGADGSAQKIVAVARSGTKDEAGVWRNIADSDPVQITAHVTGIRSIEAAVALRMGAPEGEADADFVKLVQEASVFTPYGDRKAPSLSTVGNITLKAGDSLALHDLFSAGAETALYRVALRDDASVPGARLMLEGEDVTHRIDFTPEEFINLQFMAGPDGSAADLLVVARAGTKDEAGVWRHIVDSPATQITAAVTGARSANAAPALRSVVDPGDADAGFLRVAQEATIFAATGARKAPAISDAGDLTVKAGDALSIRDLFPTSGMVEVALYRVALRDDPGGAPGGRLLLDGEDVSHRTDFSPMEFLSLQYVAGPEGGAQDILVVARAGTPDEAGGLTAIADSAPAALRAAVTGTRSLNMAEALRTAVEPGAADAGFMRVASEAMLYAPLSGQVAPGLSTAGNITAAAGDQYALRDLFTSPYSAAVEVTGYRVALRDEDLASGTRLMLNGEEVTHRIGFTAEEFNALQFVAGATGSAQDILVVARSSKPDGTGIIASRAVQITASVTGERSVNALPALRNASPEDAYAGIAQDAAVHAPLAGQKAPALSAVGDFTAAAGDLFSMNTLFDTAGGSFDEGMTYRVAMRDDPSGTAGGRLILNGGDVTGRTDFTGAEFAALLFQAGPEGSAQDLLVVARSTGANGLITDSPALEITARATGTRSINALAALRMENAAESGFDRVIRDAAVYDSASAPVLSSSVRPSQPALSAQALAAAVGAYRATGSAGAATPIDLTALFGGVVGASRAAGAASARLVELSGLVTLLGGGTVGGVRSVGPDIAKLAALAFRADA